MLRLAVSSLLADARIAQVRVAVAPTDKAAAEALRGLPRTVWRACGGPSRAETVLNALADASRQGVLEDDSWVLVHDAARPGLPAAALARLIDACLEIGQGGLLALPVADTVKRQADEPVPRVQASVPREGLWQAQTPQMFPAGQLSQALRQGLTAGPTSGVILTDEASAVERLGHWPLLVTGSMRNFKVTWPEDFELMAKWLD